MRIKKIGQGKIATNQQPLYRQGNKISTKPIYPLKLHDFEYIDPLQRYHNKKEIIHI